MSTRFLYVCIKYFTCDLIFDVISCYKIVSKNKKKKYGTEKNVVNRSLISIYKMV